MSDIFYRFKNQQDENEKEMRSGVKVNIGVHKVRTSGTRLPIYLPDIVGEFSLRDRRTEEDSLRDRQNMG